MAYTQATNKAVQKYSKKAYDTTVLRFKKGQLDSVKKHAESKGLSLNAYVLKLIEKDIKEGVN